MSVVTIEALAYYDECFKTTTRLRFESTPFGQSALRVGSVMVKISSFMLQYSFRQMQRLFASEGMSLSFGSPLSLSLSLRLLNKWTFHNRVNVCNCSFSVLAPTLANKRDSVETLGAVFSLQRRLNPAQWEGGRNPQVVLLFLQRSCFVDVSDAWYQI